MARNLPHNRTRAAQGCDSSAFATASEEKHPGHADRHTVRLAAVHLIEDKAATFEQLAPGEHIGRVGSEQCSRRTRTPGLFDPNFATVTPD